MSILKDLHEVLKGLKRKKSSKPAPKFCPKCGNHKIRLCSSLNTYPRMYGIAPSQYICESCGYKGPIYVEIEEENS
jgi:predicted RNA-binding Zn-ribbon protein involved in translation (DUF1610 family)